MTRRNAANATAARLDAIREDPHPSRWLRSVGKRSPRLTKRKVLKPDGRYLIYYEQSMGPSGRRLARKA